MHTIRFLLLLLLSPALSSALAAADFQEDEFRQELESFREEYGLTAMVVGIWSEGDPLYREALGTSQPGVPAELPMKFRAGGICLTSLTAVLLQTAESGKVSLDDTIEPWMPDLPDADKVTLRMLANCTSGYGDYVPSQKFIDDFAENPFRFFTPEELIAYGLEGGMLYEPGTNWNYSHTTFVMLGVILEKIHNKPVSELLQEQIIAPLQLQDTVYTEGPALAPPVLHSFTTERGVFEESTFWNPSWTSYSGSLAAPLDDVATIIRAIGSASIISPESLAEMTAPTTAGMNGNTTERFYGMGIGVMGDWMMQNPSFGGYQGIILYNMKTDTTMVAFMTLGQKSDPNTHYGMKLLPTLMQQ